MVLFNDLSSVAVMQWADDTADSNQKTFFVF